MAQSAGPTLEFSLDAIPFSSAGNTFELTLDAIPFTSAGNTFELTLDAIPFTSAGNTFEFQLDALRNLIKGKQIIYQSTTGLLSDNFAPAGLKANTYGRATFETGFFDSATNTSKFQQPSIATSILTNGADFLQRNGSVTWTANQGAGSFKLTNLANPTANNEIITTDFLPGSYSTKIELSANQTITGSASDVPINFNQENFDNGSMHDNVTNNTRITFPVAGRYQIFAILRFQNAPTTNHDISVYVNGANTIAKYQTTTTSLIISTTYSANASDYAEILVSNGSASDNDILATSTGYSFAGAFLITRQ